MFSGPRVGSAKLKFSGGAPLYSIAGGGCPLYLHIPVSLLNSYKIPGLFEEGQNPTVQRGGRRARTQEGATLGHGLMGAAPMPFAVGALCMIPGFKRVRRFVRPRVPASKSHPQTLNPKP